MDALLLSQNTRMVETLAKKAIMMTSLKMDLTLELTIGRMINNQKIETTSKMTQIMIVA
jgi:hypothetical protein